MFTKERGLGLLLKTEKMYVIQNKTKLITKSNKDNNKKQQKRKCENMGTTMNYGTKF